MTKEYAFNCTTVKTRIALVICVLLSGCADHIQTLDVGAAEVVGFWYGVWHGLILPFAFGASLFLDDVAIYAVYNNGCWYDFGFLLGISLLTSGSYQREPRD